MSNDAEALRNAMKGFGTNKDTLIKTVSNKTNLERQEIKSQYKALFGRDLISDLKSKLTGKLEDAFVALFTDPIEYDVDSLRYAMKGLGTDEDTLIEILASRSNIQLHKIRKLYKEKYNRDLETDIRKETHGTLEYVLVSLLQGKRSTNINPDQNQCLEIAKEIYRAGEEKMGTEESIFNKYFVSLSPYELVLVAKYYYKLSGNTILQAIEKEFSRDKKKAFITIVYATISPSEYFATRINDAIKGFTTKDNILTRVLVSREEIDIPEIKQYYIQLYGKDMVEDIKKNISGDYQNLMLELCNH